MTEADMPSPEELRRLLRGEIEAERARELYRLLAESDEALNLAEGIWADESPLTTEDLPPLTDRRSARIERRIFLEIRRTHLAENVSELAGGAFLSVVLGLLNAALSMFEAGEPSQTPERRTP